MTTRLRFLRLWAPRRIVQHGPFNGTGIQPQKAVLLDLLCLTKATVLLVNFGVVELLAATKALLIIMVGFQSLGTLQEAISLAS